MAGERVAMGTDREGTRIGQPELSYGLTMQFIPVLETNRGVTL